MRRPNHAALHQLANRLVGNLHGCLKTRTHHDEVTAWPHHADKGCCLTFSTLRPATGPREPIFDSEWTARAYITSGIGRQVFLWDGRLVGQLRGDTFHGLNGHHVGWYMNGVVYDRKGLRVWLSA